MGEAERPRRLRGRPASARRGARAQRTHALVRWRLWRAGLLAIVPAMLALFVAARVPPALPTANLPETFDGSEALDLAKAFLRANPDRSPGSGGAERAATWVGDRLSAVRPELRIERQDFRAPLASGEGATMANILAIVPGESPEAVLLLARRDGPRIGTGANYSGSGTGLLLAMATALAGTRSARTVVLASVDGSTAGDAGAAYLAENLPGDIVPVAAISLDGVGRDTPLRLFIDGSGRRRTPPTLLGTTRRVLEAHEVAAPVPPGVLTQAASLLLPLPSGPQRDFIDRHVPALALDGSIPDEPPLRDVAGTLSATRIGDLGASAQSLTLALSEGPAPPANAVTYVLAGDRAVRGWSIQLVLFALLVPALIVLADSYSRVRRRIALGPVLQAVLWRSAPLLAALLVLRLEGAAGRIPGITEPPFAPDPAGISWQLLLLPALAFLGTAWLAHRRIPPAEGDPTAVGAATWLSVVIAACGAAFLAALGTPFGIALVLPAAHIWLLLPGLAAVGAARRLGVVSLGLLGIVLWVVLEATAGGLGWEAPGWILRGLATGAVPLAVGAALALVCGGAWQACLLMLGRGGGRAGPDVQ